MANVFLSYPHDEEMQFDKLQMDEILKNLKKCGYVKADDKIVDSTKVSSPGTDIRKKLRAAMDAASKVVVIWTGESAKSQFANYENGLADALEKPLIVAVPSSAKNSLPAELRHAQFIPLKSLMPDM
jgi:hypothetical protein